MSDGYQWHGSELLLDVLVLPNSSRNQVVGIHDGAIKIKITAAAVDNKANQQLCHFLAKLFGVSKRKVSLLKGHRQKYKRVRIVSAPSELPACLLKI